MQSSQIEAIKRDLYETLNKQRANYKKRSLCKHALGELAVTDLLMSGVTKNDQGFKQTTRYALLDKQNICSLIMIRILKDTSISLMQLLIFILQEIKSAYLKAFDDMINGPYKTKLLMALTNSHVSISIMQQGTKGEKFVIAAISFKMSASVFGLIFCSNQQEPGFILGGKMVDQSKKPMLVILNRGSQNQICLGNNRIVFDQETGEFRVEIPEFYQGLTVSQVLNRNQEYNRIEIFVINATDNSFQYGSGSDIPNNFNGYSNMELGFMDIIADMKEVKEVKANVSQLIQEEKLFEEQSQKSLSTGPPPSSISQPTNQIRLTKTQILRQQQALQKKAGDNPTQQIQQQQIHGQNQNLTPQFNRSQTFTIGANRNTNLTPSFNNNLNNNFQTQQQPQRLNFYPGTENQNPNQGFKFQFNSNSNSQQPSSGPSLMKFNTQVTQNFATNGFQNPFGNKLSAQNVQGVLQQSNNSAFQQTQVPKFAFNSQQTNPQYQTVPQVQIKFNNQQPLQQFQQQKFNNFTQGPAFQSQGSNFNIVNQPHQQSFQPVYQQQAQVSTTPPPSATQQSMLFSQLSPIDQETLKGYLKEISTILSQDQIQKITALMLTEPMQFYKYYQTALSQFQESKQMIGSKSHAQLPQLNQNQQAQQKPDESKNQRIKDFDDMTLFLTQLPSRMYKSNEVKFQMSLQQVKDGLLEPRQLLRDLIIRKNCPINESFKGLHESKNHSDLLLILGQNEFYCHQIVFTSSSSYFKKAIDNSKQINKYQYGLDESSPAKLVCPNWMDIGAVKNFIFFMYTGKLKSEKQMTVQQIVELLKVANNFYHQYLQEYMISTMIIPNITPSSAIQYLKLCTSPKDQPHFQQSSLNAWEYLKLYSYFYLQKHLPTLLRSNSQLLYELELVVMREVIDKSFLYIIDGSKDLETILNFAAETWADKSISKFFLKVQKTLDSCSAFDYQIIPQMPEFFKGRDSSIDYRCKHIQSEENITKASISSRSEANESSAQQSKLDSTFIQVPSNPIDDSKKDKDLANWKPSTNVLPDDINAQALFETKEPQFTTQINMDMVKSDFEANKGVSIISRAFDFGRRCWHLKVDIDYDNNMSLWIIERGKPLNSNSQDVQIGQSVPIKFSSIIFQFELVDAAFGEYKSFVFHSFAHDHHQVIGHQNFINLSQLKDRGEINLKVHMKEFILHSALVHHLAGNFSEMYQKDQKQINLIKKTYSRNNLMNDVLVKDYEVLSLPFFTLQQMLCSNELKIEDENTLLGFLFYYTKIQSLAYRSSNMAFIADTLASNIRFQYISTKKIMSALRDNEILRSSKVFMHKVHQEFSARVQHTPTLSLNIGTNSKQLQNLIAPRKFYDMAIVVSQGRKKIEVDAATGKQTNPFIEELIDWFKNSKHLKEDDSIVHKELQQYKSLYYEEKSRNAALEQAHYYTQRQLSAQKKQYEATRSKSLGKLFDTCDTAHIQQQPLANLPAYLRGRQSPAKQSQVLNKNPTMNNKQLLVDQEQRQPNFAAYNRNNSFDQSRYVQDNRRFMNDSIFADQRVKQNLNADFSQILGVLDQSDINLRRYDAQMQPVAYYRRNQIQRNNSNNNECIIF